MGQIGAGMKPRVKNPDRRKKEDGESPTVGGQETASSEAVLGVSEGVENGGQMESENPAVFEPSVAPSEVNNLGPETDLEAAMNQPEDISQGEKRESQSKYDPWNERGTMIPPPPELISNLELSPAVPEVGGVLINHQLPDGSHMAVVTIPEGWWEPITQWAEENGVTPEQWLSDRLYEYVSSYGSPAGKR